MTQTLSFEQLNEVKIQGRQITRAVTGDPTLGPFALLPGSWVNVRSETDPPGPDPLPGRGWTLSALPFPGAPGPPFRLLLNQYNERLDFFVVDRGVPNRGGGPAVPSTNPDCDQHVVTLDYEQGISQIAAEDFPVSGKAGDPQLPIHHEPGLFLNMLDQITDDEPNIARLATIPHGDAALALGRSTTIAGPPTIPTVNPLPIGVAQDLADEDNRWLDPYRHFRDEPPLPPGDPGSKNFKTLFDPTDPTELLRVANEGVDILETVQLEFDTTTATGGIHNIPFIVKQANASEMKATFWIQKLAETDDNGENKLRLQYVQIVQLDFHARFDGGPGRIKWPHVSINTLEKQLDDAPERDSARVMP